MNAPESASPAHMLPDLPAPPPPATDKAPIWWSNAIFFVSMHVVALVGMAYWSPLSQIDRRTAVLCLASWNLATYGITVGYHRLWSHRGFKATRGLRIVLAGMGCLGFQGSIKWWVLRHRLHHRFTDTTSDPYNANQGLYFSHMGWIFRKPVYPKMPLIDRKDLEADPVVRFQHRHYIPLTLGLGLVLPTLVGALWGDALGGFIYGGVVARLLIWHCTFMINSLAHYIGDQAYTLDLTARGSFLLSILTGGEANHNYHHAFPHDYRNGPRLADFDPTKWLIYLLHHYTPLVPSVVVTPEEDILKAKAHVERVRSYHHDPTEDGSGAASSNFAIWSSYAGASSDPHGSSSSDLSAGGSQRSSAATSSEEETWSDDADTLLDNSPPASRGLRRRMTQQSEGSGSRSGKEPLPSWTRKELQKKVAGFETSSSGGKKPLVLLIEGHAVDATSYIAEHPGGAAILWEYAVTKDAVVDATDAFLGGLNRHGWTAKRKVRERRIARVGA